MMIDPEKYYSLLEIIDEKIFPWVESLPTLSRWVNDDKELFKPIMKGKGPGTRYYLKGANLLSILKQADEGKLVTNGKQTIHTEEA